MGIDPDELIQRQRVMMRSAPSLVANFYQLKIERCGDPEERANLEAEAERRLGRPLYKHFQHA
jgi:hypothetical protein